VQLVRQHLVLLPDQVLRYFLQDLEHISRFNRFIDIWLEEENCRYDRYLKSDNDESRYEYRSDLSVSLNEIYPQVSRQALVMFLYSALEDNLNQFCKSLKNSFHLEDELLNAKGKGLERVKHYITKSTPLEFPSMSISWQSLNDFKKFRDVIAHTSGYLDSTNQKHDFVAAQAEREPTTSVSRFARDRLVIEQSYIEKVVENVKTFYEALLESYGQAKV
jgi:hypothetical protein